MLAIHNVLKASKGIHVDDTFAELWGRKLSNAYTVATYTGTLPATLQTVEGYLESYKIYGNTVQGGTPTPENPIEPEGVGERTANLFDASTVEVGGITPSTGAETTDSTRRRSGFISVEPSADYGLSREITSSGSYLWVIAYDENKTIVTDATALAGYSGVLVRGTTLTVNQWTFATTPTTRYIRWYVTLNNSYRNIMLNLGSTALPYEPYGYKLPILSNSTVTDIYIGDTPLAKDEYVDSSTGKIYRRTKNLSPPEEEWVDGQIGGGDGTVNPSTQIKVSPFIDVSTCETCIMEVFSAETEWAAAGYREMAFYDENKQYLGWIGGGGRQTLTPNSTEMLSEFPAGTVYVRIGCSHGDQPFFPQLVSGYTPTHQFYPYLVPTDPPVPFPQIPTSANSTTINWAGEGLAPSEVELTYRKRKG